MIYGVGNAIMDITASVSEDFISRHGVEKGMMSLVDLDTSTRILEVLRAEGVSVSLSAGGSVANSIAGIASQGQHATALFFLVGDDELGREFMRQTSAGGTQFNADLCVKPGATGRSIILVTPDGERTMLTHLGVSVDFGPDHIDHSIVRTAAFGFIEGYLLGTRSGREAAELLAFKTAITLSDPRCVTDNIYAFQQALTRSSIVIGNAKEMAALSGFSPEEGMRICNDTGAIAVCTRSARPTLISETRYGRMIEVPVTPVDTVVDTTGAGDQFAAGFLNAFLSGERLETAAVRGGEMAGRVIQHAGARPPLHSENAQRAAP